MHEVDYSIDSYLSRKNDYSVLIAKMLTAFKSDSGNVALINYLSESNIFDSLGKGRDEMLHSRVLADIFCGSMFSPSQGSAIQRLFDLVVEKADEQGISIDREIKTSVLTSSLQILDCTDVKTEYTVAKYLEDYANKEGSASLNRIDLFMRFNVGGTETNGKHAVEFFVENKVGSIEHGEQTQSYYDQCADGRRAAQFFVYLTADEDDVCCAKNRNRLSSYIHITYQDIMDHILVPLTKTYYKNSRENFLLREYINCLELPSLLEDATDSYMIMATSSYEKQLISSFINNPNNRQLVNLVVNSVIQNKLYSYNGDDLLSFDDAAERLIMRSYRTTGMFHTLKSLKGVCGAQKGGSPFVINVISQEEDTLFYLPTHLYEYKGKAFPSIAEALNRALGEFYGRAGIKDKQELIDLFLPLYGRQKGGRAVLVTSADSDYKRLPDSYLPTDFEDLYIRSQIDWDKLFAINKILGDGYHINDISEECYNNTICSKGSGMLKTVKTHPYIHVDGTSLYFRKGQEDKIDKINEISDIQILECQLSEYDEQLLSRFFDNNRKLILSVFQLLASAETDSNEKKRLADIYSKLKGKIKSKYK